MVVLLAGALALTGCDTGSGNGGGGGTTGYEFDIVVVGTGIGGGLTALSALEAGAERVLVIDKMAQPGGSTRFTGGNFTGLHASAEPLPAGTWDPSIVASHGPANFAEHWARHALVDDSFPFPDFARTVSTFGQARAAIQWMDGVMNIPFGPYRQQAPYATNPRGLGRPNDGGVLFVSAYMAELDRRGAYVWMGTEMTGLIMEDGRVAGIRARRNNNTVYIRASDVVLATGGFSASPARFAEWTNAYDRSLGLRRASIGNVCESNTGDGILVAMRDANAEIYRHSNGQPSVWAVISGLGNPALGTFTVPAGGVTVANTRRNTVFPLGGDRPIGGAGGGGIEDGVPLFGLNDQIMVNHLGQRFVNEDQPLGSGAFNNVFNAVAREEGPVWIIYSYDTTTPAMRITLQAMAELQNDVAHSAEYIVDLAGHMGVDPVALGAAIVAYNTDAVDEFGKAVNRVVPLETGPFFAVQAIPANIIGTIGGLRTTENGQVLNTTGAIIPNLFAVGEISNRSFFGQGYVGGSCLSLFAVISRNVGRFIAESQ